MRPTPESILGRTLRSKYSPTVGTGTSLCHYVTSLHWNIIMSLCNMTALEHHCKYHCVIVEVTIARSDSCSVMTSSHCVQYHCSIANKKFPKVFCWSKWRRHVRPASCLGFEIQNNFPLSPPLFHILSILYWLKLHTLETLLPLCPGHFLRSLRILKPSEHK